MVGIVYWFLDCWLSCWLFVVFIVCFTCFSLMLILLVYFVYLLILLLWLFLVYLWVLFVILIVLWFWLRLFVLTCVIKLWLVYLQICLGDLLVLFDWWFDLYLIYLLEIFCCFRCWVFWVFVELVVLFMACFIVNYTWFCFLFNTFLVICCDCFDLWLIGFDAVWFWCFLVFTLTCSGVFLCEFCVCELVLLVCYFGLACLRYLLCY